MLLLGVMTVLCMVFNIYDIKAADVKIYLDQSCPGVLPPEASSQGTPRSHSVCGATVYARCLKSENTCTSKGRDEGGSYVIIHYGLIIPPADPLNESTVTSTFDPATQTIITTITQP